MRERLTPQAAAILRRIFNDVGIAIERDAENVARVVPKTISKTISPAPGRRVTQPPTESASPAAVSVYPVRRGEFSRVCAWCAPAEGKSSKAKGKGVSHGICPACAAKYFPRPQSAANKITPLAVAFVGEPAGFACPVGLGVTGAGTFERSFPR